MDFDPKVLFSTVCVAFAGLLFKSLCFTSSSRKRNTIAVCAYTRFGKAKRKQLFSAPILHTNTTCVRMTSTQHKQHRVFVPVFKFKLLAPSNERCVSCIDLDTFVIRLIKLQINRWIPSLSKCGNHSIASEKKKMREQTAVWLTGYRNKAKFRTILHWIAFATRRNLMIKVLSSKWNEANRRTIKSSFGQFLISSWLDGNSNKTNTV